MECQDTPGLAQLSIWGDAMHICSTLSAEAITSFISYNARDFSADSGYRNACFVGACHSGRVQAINVVLECCRAIPRAISEVCAHNAVYASFERQGTDVIEYLLRYCANLSKINYARCLAMAVANARDENVRWLLDNAEEQLSEHALFDAILVMSQRRSGILPYLLSSLILAYARAIPYEERVVKRDMRIREVLLRACIHGDYCLALHICNISRDAVEMDSTFILECCSCARARGHRAITRLIMNYAPFLIHK